jgi:hypothetical protein
MPVTTRSSPAPTPERRTRMTNTEANQKALYRAQQFYQEMMTNQNMPATRTTRASAHQQEPCARMTSLEANQQALIRAQQFYQGMMQDRNLPASTRTSPARTPKRSNQLTISEDNQQAVVQGYLLSSQPSLPAPPLRSPSRFANRRASETPSVEEVTPSSKKKTPTRRSAKKKNDPSFAKPVRSSPRLRRQNLAPNEVESNPNNKTRKAVADASKHQNDPMPTTPMRSPFRDRRLKSTPEEVSSYSSEGLEKSQSIALRVKTKRNEKASVVKDPNIESSALSHLPRAPVFDLPPLSSSASRLKIKSTKGEPLMLPRPPSSSLTAMPTIASMVEADPVLSIDVSSFKKTNASSAFSWLLQLVSLYFFLVLSVYFFHYNSLPPMDSMNEPFVSLDDAALSLNASMMGLSTANEAPTMVDEL